MPDATPSSIGSARMLDDGTLVLTLRADDGRGTVGTGELRYPPTHPAYSKVLAHLGGMKPGEQKPVPPFA